MVAGIEEALDAAPPDLAALVVEGEGGVFSAGADLKALSAALAKPPAPGETDPLQALNAAGRTLLRPFRRAPFVTIAVVDGAAVGGGMGLAAAADIVLATPKARFALTETSLGTPAGADRALSRRPPRRAGRAAPRADGRPARRARGGGGRARRHLLRQRRGARRASSRRSSKAIERCAPGANAETKRLFRACRAEPPEAYIETAAQSFAAALRGPEGREGLAAFVGKRPPSWARGPK